MPIMGVNTVSRHATEGLAKVLHLEGRAWPNPMQVSIIWPLNVRAGSKDQADEHIARMKSVLEKG